MIRNKKILLTISLIMTLMSCPCKGLCEELSNEQIDRISAYILEPLKDGFQVSDLISIISHISESIENKYLLSQEEKCQMTSKILCHLIDITDTPGLPDFIFDRIFKELVPYFVRIMFPNKQENQSTIAGNEKEALDSSIEGFFTQLQDGFTLEDIPYCISYCATLYSTYTTLTQLEKKSAAKELFFQLINKTDTPYLPDFIFDDIFKQIGGQLIDYLMDHLAN